MSKYVETGSSVKVNYGRFSGITGTYVRWSALSDLHIIRVPNDHMPSQTVEIALRDNEFEVVK